MKSLGASLHLGATVRDDGVVFRAWAPRCRTLDVVIEGRRPLAMTRQDDGLFEGMVAGLPSGTRYQYRLDGERYRPDPASRFQPEGVHGPSTVVNPASFPWTDRAFTGHALADLVIYELHVGTFTAAGTFEAIVPHLPNLVELGVTAVELMPVAEFPGSRNWGYDGVHLFAAQSTYGGPRGLRRLVDACHAHGLSVILDVVYNHLGPEGNYLGEFGPYFTDRYRTPWGGAVNFDGPEAEGVRRHFVENARAWVRECHVDGLRLDAIHAIFDAGPTHILTEISTAVREEARALGRPVHIMAESHDNDRRLMLPAAEGGIGLDAVWSDDFHHAVHVRLTGERGGYYADFTEPRRLATALAEGFAFQGEYSEYFRRDRGTPSADLPGERFVICVQNHDQVGNRAQGDRLSRGGEEGAYRGVQPFRVAGGGARSGRARNVRALAPQPPAGGGAAPPRALPVLPALAGPASHAPRPRGAGQGACAGGDRRQGHDADALPRRRVRPWRAADRQPHKRGAAGTDGTGRLAPAARLRRSTLRGPGPPRARPLSRPALRDSYLGGGPDMAPTPPNARSAPAQPRRSSITRVDLTA